MCVFEVLNSSEVLNKIAALYTLISTSEHLDGQQLAFIMFCYQPIDIALIIIITKDNVNRIVFI